MSTSTISTAGPIAPQGKWFVWSLTYSPETPAQELPNDIMKWIETYAYRYLIVREMAGKHHVQASIVLKKALSRTAPYKAMLALNKTYKKPLLDIHKHDDIAGSIGYQDDDCILHNVGFKESDLAKCKEYYKERHGMKYYTQHKNTMREISIALAQLYAAHIVHAEHVDDFEAKRLLVKRGFYWVGCPDYTPYFKACKLRDRLMGDPTHQ